MGKKFIDIKDQTFFELTAISHHSTDKQGAVWNCLCSCGTFVLRRTGKLRSGIAKSCGCVRRRKASERVLARKEPIYDIFLKSKKRVYIASAKKRNLEYSISDSYFENLLLDNCHYCGAIPSNIFTRRMKYEDLEEKTIKYNGIDRIDTKKGYIEGNVVSCCFFCNRAKSDRSKEEFQQWLDNLVLYRLERLGLK